jgi:hypothetical protein
MDPKRSEGSLASAFATTASRFEPRPRAARDSGGASTKPIRRTVSASLCPRNKRLSLSDSQITTPIAKMSLATPISPRSRISGARYASFPSTASLTREGNPMRRARPRSVTRVVPSAPTRRFCGDTSRCT